MIPGADATGGTDKRCGDEITDPDTNPRLPPRETGGDHGRGDHPCILGTVNTVRTSLPLRSRERHAGHRRSKHTMLAESAIQKATKFHEPHLRRAASTVERWLAAAMTEPASENTPGRRSLLVKNNWADVRPGSLLTAALSA